MKRELKAPALHDIECLQCALKQVVDTTEIAGLSREERIPLMFKAVEHLSRADHNINNSVIINECYRIVTEAIGDDNPYREQKRLFNEESAARVELQLVAVRLIHREECRHQVRRTRVDRRKPDRSCGVGQ